MGYCRLHMPSVPRTGSTWFRAMFETATSQPSFSMWPGMYACPRDLVFKPDLLTLTLTPRSSAWRWRSGSVLVSDVNRNERASLLVSGVVVVSLASPLSYRVACSHIDIAPGLVFFHLSAHVSPPLLLSAAACFATRQVQDFEITPRLMFLPSPRACFSAVVVFARAVLRGRDIQEEVHGFLLG